MIDTNRVCPGESLVCTDPCLDGGNPTDVMFLRVEDGWEDDKIVFVFVSGWGEFDTSADMLSSKIV